VVVIDGLRYALTPLDAPTPGSSAPALLPNIWLARISVDTLCP
jgi:hypothetical protein